MNAVCLLRKEMKFKLLKVQTKHQNCAEYQFWENQRGSYFNKAKQKVLPKVIERSREQEKKCFHRMFQSIRQLRSHLQKPNEIGTFECRVGYEEMAANKNNFLP